MISPLWRKLEISTAILPEEAQRLRALAKDKNVLEIGAAHGYSAIIMALEGARVTSVDSHEGTTQLGDTYTSMCNNLEAFGVTDRVEIIRGLSQEVMPMLNGKQYDFIFLDGNGAYEENVSDLTWALKLIKPGEIIARHDYGHEIYGEITKAIDKVFPNGADKITNSLFEIKIDTKAVL